MRIRVAVTAHARPGLDVRQAKLEFDPRVNLHHHPITLGYEAEAIVLEGEVDSIATKKRALELAAGLEGPRRVVDRLRIAPGQRRGDGAIKDSVCASLLGRVEFRSCSLRAHVGEKVDTVAQVPNAEGEFDVWVADGVVTLDGRVPSLSHKRLAGVLAWWAPGCRDVVNSLEVFPPEEDNDAEVLDALRLALEIDPVVQAEQITATCERYHVVLYGYVRNEEERRQVERDAWALFAVDDVTNEIEVRA